MTSRKLDGRHQKFIRNRDIKLKNSELDYERKIKRLMCEGVCDKCRDKFQWKFNYVC